MGLQKVRMKQRYSYKLQGLGSSLELVRLPHWVIHAGAHLCVGSSQAVLGSASHRSPLILECPG